MCRMHVRSLSRQTNMKIFRALGLGLAIVMLKFLMPPVFEGLEDALVALFQTVQHVSEIGRDISVGSVAVPMAPSVSR